MPAYFVTLDCLYTEENGDGEIQAYHPFEGIVLAKDEKDATRIAIDNGEIYTTDPRRCIFCNERDDHGSLDLDMDNFCKDCQTGVPLGERAAKLAEVDAKSDTLIAETIAGTGFNDRVWFTGEGLEISVDPYVQLLSNQLLNRIYTDKGPMNLGPEHATVKAIVALLEALVDG